MLNPNWETLILKHGGPLEAEAIYCSKCLSSLGFDSEVFDPVPGDPLPSEVYIQP